MHPTLNLPLARYRLEFEVETPLHLLAYAGPPALDFSGLTACAERIESWKNLRWRDWTRYSSRQDRQMALGGMVGTWTLKGDLARFLHFLHSSSCALVSRRRRSRA